MVLMPYMAVCFANFSNIFFLFGLLIHTRIMRLRRARNARLTRKVKNIMRYKQMPLRPVDFAKREITTIFVTVNSTPRCHLVAAQTLR